MPEQVVHLLLARGVLAHEPPECRRFVRRVMVDVQSRVTAPSAPGPIDKPLEGALLPGFVMAPPVVELGAPSVYGHGAEEVLEPAVDQGKPLHVEEDVAPVRRGQATESAERLIRRRRDDSPGRHRPLAGLDLERGLGPKPGKHLRRDS